MENDSISQYNRQIQELEEDQRVEERKYRLIKDKSDEAEQLANQRFHIYGELRYRHSDDEQLQQVLEQTESLNIQGRQKQEMLRGELGDVYRKSRRAAYDKIEEYEQEIRRLHMDNS